MKKDPARISDAWRQAAVDLGVSVTAPFTVTTPTGEAVEFRAFVQDFGAAAGTLVCSIDDPAPRRVAEYFVSAVNPEVYSTYDRQTFVDALEDWGWFGDGPPPRWYTGVSPWG
jgi:hypothetical protein